MKLAADVLVALVAVLHVYFLVLEMFLWDKPFGRRTFGHSAESAAATKVLAANQGLYNGFLAAGLVWSLLREPVEGRRITRFFLGCVVVAGVFGGVTVKPSVAVVQALPALLALATTYLPRGARAEAAA